MEKFVFICDFDWLGEILFLNFIIVYCDQSKIPPTRNTWGEIDLPQKLIKNHYLNYTFALHFSVYECMGGKKEVRDRTRDEHFCEF